MSGPVGTGYADVIEFVRDPSSGGLWTFGLERQQSVGSFAGTGRMIRCRLPSSCSPTPGEPCIWLADETRKVSAMADPEDPRLARIHDDLICEYYKIADLVTSFDQRLLTIKGWGVTLSLASIGLGFQQSHYGLFLVAALGGLSFWIVEATTKFHQLRYYPRMGDIEVACYDLFRADSDHGPASSPLIDWGWYTAKRRVRGGPKKGESHIPQRWPEDNTLSAGRRVRFSTMLYPHVMFPHVIAMIAGTVLFVVGLTGGFGSI
jgi:hypothetical protein